MAPLASFGYSVDHRHHLAENGNAHAAGIRLHEHVQSRLPGLEIITKDGAAGLKERTEKLRILVAELIYRKTKRRSEQRVKIQGSGSLYQRE